MSSDNYDLIAGLMAARSTETKWNAGAGVLNTAGQVTAAVVTAGYTWDIQNKWAQTQYDIAVLDNGTKQLALTYDKQFKEMALQQQVQIAKESMKQADRSDRRNFIVKLVAVQAKKEYLLEQSRAQREMYELGYTANNSSIFGF